MQRRQPRQTRASTTKETQMKTEESWVPYGMLDVPGLPDKPGFERRWIRTTINGQPDPRNAMKRQAQGWKPVDINSIPEGVFIPRMKDAILGDVISIDGMVLCECPVSIFNKRARHVREQTERQMLGVKEALFRVHQPGDGMVAPSFERTSSVSKGTRVVIDD